MSEQFPELPEDADPLLKQVLVQNQQLVQQNQAMADRLSGLEGSLQERDRARILGERKAQRDDAMRSIRSHLDSVRKEVPALNTERGQDVLDLAMYQVERRLHEMPMDEGARNEAALDIFKSEVRKRSFTPEKKAEVATKSTRRKKGSIPTRPGATLPPAAPAVESDNVDPLMYEDDETRRHGAMGWFSAIAESA